MLKEGSDRPDLQDVNGSPARPSSDSDAGHSEGEEAVEAAGAVADRMPVALALSSYALSASLVPMPQRVAGDGEGDDGNGRMPLVVVTAASASSVPEAPLSMEVRPAAATLVPPRIPIAPGSPGSPAPDPTRTPSVPPVPLGPQSYLLPHMESPTADAMTGVRSLLALALARHPAMRARSYETEGAERQVESARQQFYPTPSASVDTASGGAGRTLRLTQPVWTGGRLTAGLERAELKATLARWTAEDEAQRLALRTLDVAQAYVLATRRAAAQRWAIDTLRELSAMIGRRADAEVSSNADRILISARLAQANADLTSYLSTQERSQQQMDQILAGRHVPLADLAWQPVAPSTPQLPLMLAAAQRDATSVKVAQAQQQVAQAEVAVAEAARWPTVSLVAQNARAYGRDRTADSRLFLSMDYSFGAGRSVGEEIGAAQSRALAAENTAESSRLQVGEQIVNEWQAWQAAVARRPYQEQLHKASLAVLASDRRLFVAGRRTWQEVLNSVREVNQAELALVDLDVTLGGSGHRLDLLSGLRIWQGERVPP